MCTYNGASYLQEQLDSFLWQTRLPDEIVVCDDCSQDETVEILKKFAAKSPFPVHIHVNKTNVGLTGNFDNAISRCTGDIIFLSDQDDVWLPERLEKFEAAFQKDADVGLVFCDAYLVNEKLESLNCRNWELVGFNGKLQEMFVEGSSFPILLYHNVISGFSMAFRSEYKNLISPIPDNLNLLVYDHWIGILLSSVSKLGLVTEPLVKYRQHSKQQIGARASSFDYSSKSLFQPYSFKNFFQRFEVQYPLNHILERLEAIQEHILAMPDGREIYKTVLTDIAPHIAHLRSRTKIQKGLHGHFLVIMKELLARRYHRYSNGLGSAVKDLFS
jgi:glycosyltransferase involved in cell wall biosynthesis